MKLGSYIPFILRHEEIIITNTFTYAILMLKDALKRSVKMI